MRRVGKYIGSRIWGVARCAEVTFLSRVGRRRRSVRYVRLGKFNIE